MTGEQTRALHFPTIPEVAQRPMGGVVWRSSAFGFETAQEYTDVLAGTQPGFSYSRVDNPTSWQLAASIAQLEGHGLAHEVEGAVFGSGMGAISATFIALLKAGDHVVAPAQVYGQTWSFLTGLLARYGVRTTFVDIRDHEAVAAALAVGPASMLYAETLANPSMAVADLPALAELAHAVGAPLVIDSTFASPVVCRPLLHGADVVVHSATKYLGGHSDVTAGAAVARPDLIARIRAARSDLGSVLSPDDAFLVQRGLSTLPLRVRAANLGAETIAAALVQDRALTVDHPSLPSHPDHLLATKLFEPGLFGAIVSVSMPGGRAAGQAFCDALQVVSVATSLGGVHSKVSHVASTTHRQMDDATLLAAGIDPSTVRISVGIEDAADLVADIEQALAVARG